MKKCLFLMLALPVWANADLWVSTVQPSSSSMPPAPDGSQVVDFVVRNIGNQTAFNFTIGVYSNRGQNCTSGLILEDQFIITSLPAGGETHGQYVLHSRPGDTSIYAMVKADITNVVIENSETNNCLPSFSISIFNPDLLVSEPSGATRFVAGGDPQPINFSIVNQSSPIGYPSNSSHARYFLSTATSNPPLATRLQERSAVPQILEGQSEEVNQNIAVPATAALGFYNLFIQADGDQEVTERNESNNFRAWPVEVVEICDLADVNGDGTVNTLDFIRLVNNSVTLVTATTEAYNIRRSPQPFPEIINRQDLLSALPCFGTFSPTQAAGGDLTGFSVVSLGNGNFRLDASLQGDVTGIDVLVKMPDWATLYPSTALDALSSAYVTTLNPAPGQHLLVNEFRTTAQASRTFSAATPVATFSSGLDLSRLRTVTDPKLFDMGVAVWVTFADNTQKVLMKRFDYLNLKDPALISHLEQRFGLAPGTPIPGYNARSVTNLLLADSGLTDLTGIEHLTSLKTLYVPYNNIPKIPDLLNLAQLEDLTVSRCGVQSLGSLPPSLKRLGLGRNQLTELPDLSQLVNIEILVLEDNQLTRLPDLRQMTNLSFLSFSYNNITTVTGLPNRLTYLNAGWNPLTSLPLQDASRLSMLAINDCYFSSVSAFTGLTFPPDFQLLIYRNNLSREDCPDIAILEGKAAYFETQPQRMFTNACPTTHD